jgi:hypothetical protein
LICLENGLMSALSQGHLPLRQLQLFALRLAGSNRG